MPFRAYSPSSVEVNRHGKIFFTNVVPTSGTRYWKFQRYSAITGEVGLAAMSALLLGLPGLTYLGYGWAHLDVPKAESSAIRAFRDDRIDPGDGVIADYFLSGLLADRERLYVYEQLPKGTDLAGALSQSRFAFLRRNAKGFPYVSILAAEKADWRQVMVTSRYLVFERASRRHP